MLTIPGKDFVAIADVIRVDLATLPPSNDSITGGENENHEGPPQEVITMTLRIVHQPHLLNEFDMHPHQTMDEHAHYHFYSPLEISASKFLDILSDARGAGGSTAAAHHRKLSRSTSGVVLPDPTATSGSLTVSCTGNFDTSTSLQLSVNLQAVQPSCNQPASASASAMIPFGCCLTTTSPAYAVFTTNPGCRSCSGSAIPYAAGAGAAATGPLMADLGSTCGLDGLAPSSPGTITNAVATFTCLSRTLVSFTITAPAFSKLSPSSVEFLVRCNAPAQMCDAFKLVSTLTPASRYNVVQDTTASGYSLTWQWSLPNSGCSCSSASVAVRASGTFVGVCGSGGGLRSKGRKNKRGY
eukprot:gene13887-14007_t